MKKHIFFLCIFLAIVKLHAMEEMDNAIAEATEEVRQLRERATTLEKTIRSNVRGFENFEFLNKTNFRASDAFKRKRAAVIMEQLAENAVVSPHPLLYTKAISIAQLEYEGIALEEAIKTLEIISRGMLETGPVRNNAHVPHSSPEKNDYWCELL